MPRCGCGDAVCTCQIRSGENALVTGDGSVGDPFVYTPIYAGSALPNSTLERYEANSVGIQAGSQQLRMASLIPRNDQLSTGVRLCTGTLGASATPTLIKIGLFSINQYGDGVLIAITPNDTTLFTAANTCYTKNWSVPIQVFQNNRYAIGLLIVSGVNTGTYTCSSLTNATRPEAFALPWVSAQLTGQPDMPTQFLYTSLVDSNLPIYARLT